MSRALRREHAPQMESEDCGPEMVSLLCSVAIGLLRDGDEADGNDVPPRRGMNSNSAAGFLCVLLILLIRGSASWHDSHPTAGTLNTLKHRAIDFWTLPDNAKGAVCFQDYGFDLLQRHEPRRSDRRAHLILCRPGLPKRRGKEVPSVEHQQGFAGDQSPHPTRPNTKPSDDELQPDQKCESQSALGQCCLPGQQDGGQRRTDGDRHDEIESIRLGERCFPEIRRKKISTM